MKKTFWAILATAAALCVVPASAETDATSMSAQDLAAALGENWTVSNGKAMLKVFEGPVVLSDGEIYTVASSETLEGEDGISPIAVAEGASAVINIKSGVTLTINGADASGTNAAAPAIRVPASSTLYIVGDGTLVATGGAAANGGNSANGGDARSEWDGNKVTYLFLNGAGGDGGSGGGGAGAGIGGGGGGGATAGTGAAQSSSGRYSGHDENFPADGEEGGAGEDGSDGDACGSVFILGDVTVRVNGGAAGSAGSESRTWGENEDEIATDDWHAGGGGPGGAGGGGGAAMAIGGGGGGGGAGGGGGSGSYVVVDNSATYFSTRIDGGHGGNGGGGTVDGGGSKSDGEASEEHSNYKESGHPTSRSGKGGDGGAGGTQGGGGSLYALSSASLVVSPSREAEQPTVRQAGDSAIVDPVTVTFMSDGAEIGTETASFMFAPPTAPTPPEKAGCTFSGYFTGDGKQIYNANLTPVYPVWQTVEDVTLYTCWKVASVTFGYGGTTFGTGDLLLVGETLMPPEAPVASRDDFVFIGYFTEAEGGELVYDRKRRFALSEDSTWQPSGDITLHAHWCPESKIELLANAEGTSTDGWDEHNTHWYVLYGTGCLQPDYNHAFSTMSKTVTLPDFGIVQTGVTVTASVRARCSHGSRVWNVKVYQLDASGAVISTHVVMDEAGKAFELTDFSTEFELLEDACQLKYELNAQDAADATNYEAPGFRDRSLSVNGYLLTFVSQGADIARSIYIVDGADRPAPTAPTLIQDGCRFLGYYTEATGGERIYDEDGNPVGSWKPTADTNLYARLDPVSITFKLQDETLDTRAYQMSGNTVVPPAAPDVRVGCHVFYGYFTQAEGGEQVYDENLAYLLGESSALKITTNTTLYARRKPVTLTFNSQGVKVGEGAFSLSGNTVTPPAATPVSRNGYRFAGYYKGSDMYYNANYEYVAGTALQLDENVVLEAAWTKVYNINFVSVGATVDTVVFANGDTTPTAPAASREGYRFLGYYTAETGGVQVYDANRAYVSASIFFSKIVNEDKTLYARWVQSYTLTFVSSGGTVGTSEYTVGGTANAPIPQRAGDYTFQGYYTEGGVQVFDASGALMEGAMSGLPSDVTLYAHWAVPEGSIAKLVYRGQLNLLTGDPAVHSSTYTKKMHFRVYDSSESTTPLWTTGEGGIEVTVNKDGSFVQEFGDDTLAELLATGTVTHVGLAIGDSAMELKPRRELRPVAAVNHALTAEGAALDIRIGNLVTDNALVAADATVSQLEVTGRVTAPGAGEVAVSPLTVGDRERTRLMRGAGVKTFSAAKPTVLVPDTGAKLRGEVIATAPSDGIALITSKAGGERALRCPAVVQYCRAGESVRAPTSEAGGLKVTFFPFIGKEGR